MTDTANQTKSITVDGRTYDLRILDAYQIHRDEHGNPLRGKKATSYSYSEIVAGGREADHTFLGLFPDNRLHKITMFNHKSRKTFASRKEAEDYLATYEPKLA